MYENVMGIVLKSVNYRENDRMLTLFTREKGMLSALARGCRKQDGSLKAVSDLFCCSDLQLYEKGGRYFVTQGVLRESFYELRRDIKALMTATVLAEATAQVATAEPNPRLFALLVNALYSAMKGQDAMSVFVFFQFKLLDILGLRPELGQCVSCGAAAAPKLNLALGGAVCEACPGESVNPVWLDKIRQVYRLPSKKMNQFTVDGDRGLFLLAKRWMENVLERAPRSIALLETVL